jgi:itaconate CoA-transferase
MSIRPLDGITVVALEHVIAAPFCTRQLADLGARIIKIERPGEGDFARGYDTQVEGLSSHFVWVNRSKESITLDLKQDSALAILKSLLKTADVDWHRKIVIVHLSIFDHLVIYHRIPVA